MQNGSRRESYDLFHEKIGIDENTIKELLRICRIAPPDTPFAIPKNYDEFNSLCDSLEKKYTEKDLEEEFKIHFNGDKCTRAELSDFLLTSAKLSSEDIEEFLKCLNFEEDVITIEKLAKYLMRAE